MAHMGPAYLAVRDGVMDPTRDSIGKSLVPKHGQHVSQGHSENSFHGHFSYQGTKKGLRGTSAGKLLVHAAHKIRKLFGVVLRYFWLFC
jgi:hypothetical protein